MNRRHQHNRQRQRIRNRRQKLSREETVTPVRSWVIFAWTTILIVVPSIVSAVGAAQFVAGSFEDGQMPDRDSVDAFFLVWWGAAGVWLVAIFFGLLVFYLETMKRVTVSGVLIWIIVGALALGGSCLANITTHIRGFV